TRRPHNINVGLHYRQDKTPQRDQSHVLFQELWSAFLHFLSFPRVKAPHPREFVFLTTDITIVHDRTVPTNLYAGSLDHLADESEWHSHLRQLATDFLYSSIWHGRYQGSRRNHPERIELKRLGEP